MSLPDPTPDILTESLVLHYENKGPVTSTEDALHRLYDMRSVYVDAEEDLTELQQAEFELLNRIITALTGKRP